MRHWLLKSEPSAFSWDDQVERGVEPWTGVRNYAARNNLAAMACGDQAFFYHSNTGRVVVGLVEIVRAAYPDPTADDPRWLCVDVRTLTAMPVPVTLAAIKAHPALTHLALVRQSRLSVSPVSPEQWRVICGLGGL